MLWDWCWVPSLWCSNEDTKKDAKKQKKRKTNMTNADLHTNWFPFDAEAFSCNLLDNQLVQSCTGSWLQWICARLSSAGNKKRSHITCIGRRANSAFNDCYFSVSQLRDCGAYLHSVIVIYLRRPQRMPVQFIFSQKVNSLVGRLLPWPGCESRCWSHLANTEHN